MQLTTELDAPIIEAVPHIFKRPLLYVSPSDYLLQVATYLAIGPQIYVDGLVVLDGHKAVGTIGGQHLIKHILYLQEKWLDEKASDIMIKINSSVEAGAPLRTVLNIYSKTRFAFCPIAVNDKVAASLSLRDILKVVERSKLDISANKLSSPLTYISKDASIGNALEMMLEKGIRNLAILQGNSKEITSIVNDRKILEFLVSHDGRHMLALASDDGFEGLFKVKISVLDMLAAKIISHDLPANSVAKLFDINTPCLILDDDSIVTPWDVVMKGFEIVK
jgi:predicted transcriptional regulator